MCQKDTRDISGGRSAKRPWKQPLGELLSLPITMAAFPTVGVLFGWLLDRALNTFPYLSITLLVLGFIAGAREVWMRSKCSRQNYKGEK